MAIAGSNPLILSSSTTFETSLNFEIWALLRIFDCLVICARNIDETRMQYFWLPRELVLRWSGRPVAVTRDLIGISRHEMWVVAFGGSP